MIDYTDIWIDFYKMVLNLITQTQEFAVFIENAQLWVILELRDEGKI